MADFTLTAEIIVLAQQANESFDSMEDHLSQIIDFLNNIDDGISQVVTNMTDMGDAANKSEKSSTMSLSRMKIAMLAVGAASSKAFGSIVEWSPSMSAAMGLIKLHVGLAAMALGEALAPIIMDIVVPAIEAISNFIRNDLSPEMKSWIALTLAIIPFLIGLALAVWAVNSAMIVAVAPFIAVGMAIAAVIIFVKHIIDLWKQNEKAMVAIKIIFVIVAAAIAIFVGVLSAPIWVIALVIAGILLLAMHLKEIGGFFQNIGEVISNFASNAREAVRAFFDGIHEKLKWFTEVFSIFGLAFSIPIQFIIGTFEFLIDGILAAIDIIGSIIEAFGALLSGNFQAAGEAILSIFASIVNFLISGINGLLIDPINLVIQWVIDTFPKTSEALGIKTITPIADVSFHSGGVFQGDRPGLAWLKPRERVLTETDQNAMRSQGGGGGGGAVRSRSQNLTINIYGGKFTSPSERRREARMVMEEINKINYQRGFK